MADDTPAIVTVVLDNSIAVIRFNKPHQRNPLALSTLQELRIVLSGLLVRDDVGAIIFTGTDDVFASGANIRELEQLKPGSARDFSRLGQQIFQTIEDARQVTIAAINGYCMGGALDLALACDIRIASPDATFAHPGAQLGIITGWGGTQRLPRLIGKTLALELFLAARRITAPEALTMGLVSTLCDPVLPTAITIARSAMQ